MLTDVCDVCEGRGEHACWNCTDFDRSMRLMVIAETCPAGHKHLDDQEGNERRMVSCKACGGTGVVTRASAS